MSAFNPLLYRQCTSEDDSSACNVHINYPALNEVHCDSSHAVSDTQHGKQGDLQLRKWRRRATKQENTRYTCTRKRQLLSELRDRLRLQDQSKESHAGILNAACKTICELRCILDQANISNGKRHDRD